MSTAPLGPSVRLVALLGVVLLALTAGCGSGTDSTSGAAVSFEKHTLTDAFLSEGVAVGDVNQDGSPDVVAGSYWYEAPDWTPHAFRAVKTFPDTTWGDSFFNHVVDVNGDDWPDVIRLGFPGDGFFWYENPQNGAGDWKRHEVHSSVNNEAPRFVDVNGDGRVDVVFADGETEQMVWYEIRESLVVHTLDPNRTVADQFQYRRVELQSGQVFNALLQRREGNLLVFVDAAGRERSVPQNEVENMTVSENSLMPDHFADTIPEEDFYDLMAYLLTLR